MNMRQHAVRARQSNTAIMEAGRAEASQGSALGRKLARLQTCNEFHGR
jgi:hypothetical protein